MKKLKLSNGFIITAYVGDGFDGHSGICYEAPTYDYPSHTNCPIPKIDALRVAKLLEWYEKNEMALRLYEGTIYVGTGNRDETVVSIGECSSPYQAAYYRGGLLRLAGKRR